MRILIIDPNPTTREALCELFEYELEAQVTAHARLATALDVSAYDVALIDEQIAGAFPDAARSALDLLSKRAPLIVMGLGERVPYEEAHIAAGAVGYWPKDDDIDVLLALVRAAGLVALADRACAASRRSAIRTARRRARQRIGSPA